MWCNEGGNELTYRQVSRVTDTPDEVKTCPTHYTFLTNELANLVIHLPQHRYSIQKFEQESKKT